MKLKMSEIVNIQNSLQKIVQKSVEEKYPAFLAIKFARLAKDLEPFFSDFDKQRGELVQAMGKPDPEDQSRFIIEPDRIDVFNTEFNKMMNIEIEFVPSVSFTEKDFEAIKFDIVEAMSLLPFIKDE